MKKVISSLILCSALLASYVPAMAQNTVWREFYVSSSGNDTNAGTKSAPFKTIAKAQEEVRKINQNMQGDIIVNIEPGTYYLDEMLDFGTSDSGYGGYDVIYRGSGSEKSVISGGYEVSGFSDADGDGIYATKVEADSINQISVNGKRRYMAKGATMIAGIEDSAGNQYYNDPDTEYSYDGIYLSKRDFGMYKNPRDVFFQWNCGFYATYIKVTDIIEVDGDTLAVTFDNPTWNSLISNYSTSNPRWDRMFTVANAVELLDEPGEFYFDKSEKYLYYIPMSDENMQTATVVIPRIETLISIDGNDVDDRVQNLTFQNLHFTDTAWDISKGFRNGQSYDMSGNGQTLLAPGAVLVQRAKNIEFSDNVFSNTGAMGINYYNAVSDSKIVGNAFYDIGVTAISSGARNHGEIGVGLDGVSEAVPSAYASSPIELIDDITTKTTTSYFSNHSAIYYPGYAGPDDGGWTVSDHAHKRNVTWAEYDVLPTNVWRDNVSAAKGEKPYVMFEFLRPYTLDQISIYFPDSVTDAEKTNIEILASNDKSFATAKTIATLTDAPAVGVNHYDVSDAAKYKYVMIRKTDASDMALSRVWITSSDRKAYVKNEICRNLTISNNLIDRCGVSTNHSVGIIVTHGDSHSVCHNELYNIGYTGISIGFGWTYYKTCYNMDVGYNYVQNACRACNDGGPIYVLGPQPGSRYYNNHMINGNHAIHGLYTDNGSSEETIENNLMESSLGILSPYVSNSKMWNDGCNQYQTSDGTMLHRETVTNEDETVKEYVYYYAADTNQQEHGEVYTGSDLIRIPANNSIHDCIFRDNFGTHPYSSDAGKIYNDYEEPIMQPVGYSTDPIAYDTLTNAGLLDEYEYLKDLVPENIDNMYSRYTYDNAAYKGELKDHERTSDFMKKTVNYEIKYTLENAKFGDGLGMYPLEWKNKLRDVMTFWDSTNYGDTDTSSSFMTSKYTIARGLLLELRENLNRYSMDETIALCEELISEAEKRTQDNAIGSYPESAVAEAKTALEEVKAMSSSTAEEEFYKLTAAEDVYNNLKSAQYSAGIQEVVVPKAERVEIDEITDTVTVYMPHGESLVVSDIKITPDANSVVTAFVGGKQNLGEGITVPILCNANGRYRIWKIKAENTEAKPWITKDDFTVLSNTADFIREGKDGDLLPASVYPYIATENNGDSEASITLTPLAQNDVKTFNMIFGAGISDGFLYGNTSKTHNRFEVEFSGTEAVLYSVVNGEKIQLATASSDIVWNGENTVTYQMSTSGENTALTVKLNGHELFSETASGTFGRFAGIYSPYINVKVY